MIRRVSSVLVIASLAAACSPAIDQTAKQPPVQAASTTEGGACKDKAEQRLKLFDKPDTYPISENEKRNAYLALYNECMKEYEPKVATAKPNFEYAPGGVASELAGLSPAAGGNNANAQPKGGIITYPNGTMVIDTSQLANLSPAAGGGKVPANVSTTGNGSTVVVVQASPSSASAVAYPVPTQPSAVPVGEPLTPAAEAAPAVPQEKPASAQPEKPAKKKVARKSRPAATKETAKQNPGDMRTQFQREAVPVNISSHKQDTSLNQLQPSAGNMVDSYLQQHKAAPKD